MTEHHTLSMALQCAAVVFGLGGNKLVNKKNILGFYGWIISSAVSAVLAYMTGLWLMTGLYLVYLYFSIDGIREWSKPGPNASTAAGHAPPPVAARLQITPGRVWAVLRQKTVARFCGSRTAI
ncbi:nicotinamide mononucleotide transporter [Paraburkholderia sp. UCT31]|uniref:nicotinamide mononucleotide transporter n=1 Tax=Paraburkholderia sp. UCT31 TaxID=2615209 RepID=UPI001655DA40|nr:nicotinamide mononucleotide transporter [Paraburkholderia sp. UCT31]MBC8737274.1 nicotinamide mononucleotide transporter [Paraburkholderia sp. UCT31]